MYSETRVLTSVIRNTEKPLGCRHGLRFVFKKFEKFCGLLGRNGGSLSCCTKLIAEVALIAILNDELCK